MTQNNHGHDDKNNSVFRIAANLTITCFISGLIIAGTYALTEPTAAAERERAKNNAMKELVSDAQTFKAVEGKTGWYEARKDDKIIAYIVPTSGKGYAGEIVMLAAITPDSRAIDFKVLKHSETPGLGDKMLDNKFRKQYNDKKSADMEVVKVPTDKNIQALTGATITSRAVTTGMKAALDEVTAHVAAQKK